MNSREKILNKLRSNSLFEIEKRSLDFAPTSYDDPLKTFIKNLKTAGGDISEEIRGVGIVAEFGVAENGAVYINHKSENERKDYTFYEEITIILDKNSIVNNMHEAYKRVRVDEFGLFMAGASKTADIEQTLVIGAHGAKRMWVKFS